MSTLSGIWALTCDAPTGAAVEAALAPHSRLSPVRLCRNVPELNTGLERESTGLVLVDLDPTPQAMLDQLGSVIDQHTHSRFVALATAVPGELLASAMEAGIRQVVAKNRLDAELAPRLLRLTLKGNGSSAAQGSLIGVLSASGGAGATSIAVNLAGELHRLSSESTLLIDLDLRCGGVARYLGLKGRYCLTDVLAHSGTVDPELLRSTSVAVGESIHVLQSPASVRFADSQPVDCLRLEQTLDAARLAAPWTILDLSAAPWPLAQAMVGAADHTLLVFQLTVKDLGLAKAMLEVLARPGAADHRLIPVVNRYGSRGSLVTLAEARQVLGMGDNELLTIRDDAPAAMQAADFGQVLGQVAPRSRMRTDLVALAQNLSRRADRPATPGSARS